MNKKIIGIFVCTLMISTVGMSMGFADNTLDMQRLNDAMPAEPETPIVRDLKPIQHTHEYSPLPVDIQVTSAPEDETHLSCEKDGDGNPFVVYDKKYDSATSNIVTQFSTDNGATWPEDMIVEWELTDLIGIKPDISMASDGIFMFGTFETADQKPEVDMLLYPDIADPTNWAINYFDRSSTSTFVAETAAAVKGSDIVAIASLLDYDSGTTYLEKTILINWNCYRGEGDWPGVYFNVNNPLTHLTGDSGEIVYFCAEQKGLSGSQGIVAYYCNITEATVYTDWNSGNVARPGGVNCTYPDVCVSGKLAYCVYMNDINGNQDIYVATTTTGTSWAKYVVAESADDELYPVISANGDTAVCMFTKNNNLYVTTTKDAGKTWSDPVKVNDDTGSVIAEYGSSDIDGAYGFWASNKAGNNDIYFEEVGQFAEIVIDEIAGGVGIKATLTNVGNAEATAIPWSIVSDGLVFVGKEKSGTVTLAPGASTTVSTGLMLGFGPIAITVTADTATKTQDGTLLLFLVMTG